MDKKHRAGIMHPVSEAGRLEGPLRVWLQNPRRIFGKYIRPGMTVLDLGCGSGFFTLTLARLLLGKGKVIAADVQPGMLKLLEQKIGDELKDRIQVHLSEENSLKLDEKVDFVVAFYSFHEFAHADEIIRDLKNVMKPGARIFISEQWGTFQALFSGKLSGKRRNTDLEWPEGRPSFSAGLC